MRRKVNLRLLERGCRALVVVKGAGKTPRTTKLLAPSIAELDRPAPIPRHRCCSVDLDRIERSGLYGRLAERDWLDGQRARRRSAGSDHALDRPSVGRTSRPT